MEKKKKKLNKGVFFHMVGMALIHRETRENERILENFSLFFFLMKLENFS